MVTDFLSEYFKTIFLEQLTITINFTVEQLQNLDHYFKPRLQNRENINKLKAAVKKGHKKIRKSLKFYSIILQLFLACWIDLHFSTTLL